jgi:type II secretory pathway predicted ATPase ExeA
MRTPKPTIPGPKLRQLFERSERVFPSYPLVTRYYPAPATEDARGRLSRAIERGDGPGLIIGAPGTGKSLLLQVLASQYQERFDVVLLACARLCTRRALLQAILFELGMPYKMREEGELRLGLLDHLLTTENCPAGLLLLVDEAQSLPVALLDELRVMTNLVRGGAPRMRLVLAGTARLEETFAHPDLESFSQRLAARCYLAPFGREDTCRFIQAQIAAAGVKPSEVIADEAWDAVFDATEGVPRLVNQLCDRALEDAVVNGHPQVDQHSIESAWSELQQLPSLREVGELSSASPSASQVIEFGALAADNGSKNAPTLVAGQRLASFDELDEDQADIEPTELDAEETPAISLSSSVTPDANSRPTVVQDPFAEQFDEEEVVLDNFAAWDNMFRVGTPRVRNQRDPGFASLVQAAIEASPCFDPEFVEVRTADLASTLAETTDSDAVNTGNYERSVVAADKGLRPALRLAIVSDSEPAQSPAPVTPIGKYAQALEQMLLQNNLIDDPASGRNVSIVRPHDIDHADGNPVLVIDEEPAGPSPRPTVRREEYRHLFTRLRSG